MTATVPAQGFSRWWRPCCVLTFLILQAALLTGAACTHSPTVDEVAHLPAGLSYWQLGRFDLYCVNPPLVRLVAALPVLYAHPSTDWRSVDSILTSRYEFQVGSDFLGANGDQAQRLYFLGRLACIPFSLLGSYICYRWGREVYGSAAGLLAMALWSFDPNILGHGSLIACDVAGAALAVTACYGFWRWLHSPDFPHTLLAGVCFGLALLSKTTNIILILLFPLLAVICNSERSWPQGGKFRHRALSLLTILLVGLLVLNAGYGFEGTGQPLKQYTFVSRCLDQLAGEQSVGQSLGLTRIPMPLPRNYLRGIDLQKRDFEIRDTVCYLRGESRQGGWWYYYLYAFVVKEPLGTLAVVILALVLPSLLSSQAAPWRSEVMLVLPAVTFFLLVSSQTGYTPHYRYVFPSLPFIFILCGRAVPVAMRSRFAAVAVLVCVAASVVSSLAIYPHSLSYFNELAGGPLGGPQHLLDSNIDWGQDLLFLRQWLEEHPEAEGIRVACFGYADPAILNKTPQLGK